MDHSNIRLFESHLSDSASGNDSIVSAFEFFERVGMPAKNLAAGTRSLYRRDLTDFTAFLRRIGVVQLERVTLRLLEEYQADMDRQQLAPATRRRRTHVIKGFFRFLGTHGLLATNVALRLIPPRVPRNEPRYLSQAEYQQLQLACRHHPRDAAIIEVFLQTGMRLSELARLTIDDLTLPSRITREMEQPGVVRVLRKGGHEATLYVGHKACQALKAWIDVRPHVEHDALFISKFSRPLSPRAIQERVSGYLAEAGIRRASVHTLRHTMLTHHAAKGTSIRTLQETAGHADLKTTAIYIHLARQAMKQAMLEHEL